MNDKNNEQNRIIIMTRRILAIIGILLIADYLIF